jgi:hypothetical protein
MLVGKLGLSALVTILSLASMRICAQEAVNIADIRCVVVGLKMTAAANTPDQSKGFLLTLYYLGRLDGRAPKLEIENLLIGERGRMTSSDDASEAKRCGAGLMEKGEQITKIGKDLVESEKKKPGG